MQEVKVKAMSLLNRWSTAVNRLVPAIPVDKVSHFTLSFGFGLVAAVALLFVPGSYPFYAVLLGLVPGLVKEYMDRKTPGNTWSARDLWADFAGSGAGVGLVHLIKFLI